MADQNAPDTRARTVNTAPAATSATGTKPAETTAEKKATGRALLQEMFKTDLRKEEDGVWMNIAPGVRFKVRSQQSDTVRAAAEKLMAAHRAQLSTGARLNQEQSDEVDIALCALAIVTDWEGMDNESCTDKGVASIMRELPHVRRQVMVFTSSLDNYR